MAPRSAPLPTVNLSLGVVFGLPRGAAEAFLGLPYALPPLGARRFAPAELWTHSWRPALRDATSHGAPCHQSTGEWDRNPSEHPSPEAPPPSEDCLFVNIFRPSAQSCRPAACTDLPVMVYIHGGGFCTGSGSASWIDGARLAAEQHVIVVTLNYRLGPLGFLAHRWIISAFGATGGMNGLHDQLTALRWVRLHIGAFGGDPNRLTLFGQSSGGVSTCVLNASPLAKTNGGRLFARAIIMSGACIVPERGWGPHTMASGLALGHELAATLGATSLKALQALPPQLLQWSNKTLNDNLFAGYSMDGVLLRGWPLEAYAAGRTVATESIVGHTSRDGTAAFYGAAPLANASASDWRAAVASRWLERSAAVAIEYPLSRYDGSASAAYIDADADEALVCPGQALIRLAANSGVHVYGYSFSHLSLNCDAGFELSVVPQWRPERLERSRAFGSWATHGAELRFVFGNTAGPDDLSSDPNVRKLCPFSDARGEVALSRQMRGWWASFAAGGEPVGEVRWPRIAAPRPGAADAPLQIMEIGAPASAVRPGFKARDCAFWQTTEQPIWGERRGKSGAFWSHFDY